MALPNEIQVGRYNRFVQKLLSIKGKATTYLASPELDFVVPLFHGRENRYLEGWDLFGVAQLVVAQGVGNFSAMRLRNPVGSNVMGVVEVAHSFQSPSAAEVPLLSLARGNTADLATLVTPLAFDPRGRLAATCVLSKGNPPLAGTTVNAVEQAATGPMNELCPIGFEIPLLPGITIELISGVANVGQYCTFWWRERFLEDSERA